MASNVAITTSANVPETSVEFLTETSVNPIVPGMPTVTEIEAAAAHLTAPAYITYNGTDVNGPSTSIYYKSSTSLLQMEVPSANANDRLFLSASAVGASDVANPTIGELDVAITSETDRIVYYTGTDVPTDVATHVCHSDASGNVTLIQSPSAKVPQARVFASATAVGATPDPTLPQIESWAAINSVIDNIAFYTGTDNATEAQTYTYHIDKDGKATALLTPSGTDSFDIGRSFLSATTVGAVVAAWPTVAEVDGVLGAPNKNTIHYYTGTDTLTDDVTHLYWVDKYGTVSELQKPQAPAVLEYVTLTRSGNDIALDCSLGYNFIYKLTAPLLTNNFIAPTNVVDGAVYTLTIVSDYSIPSDQDIKAITFSSEYNLNRFLPSDEGSTELTFVGKADGSLIPSLDENTQLVTANVSSITTLRPLFSSHPQQMIDLVSTLTTIKMSDHNLNELIHGSSKDGTGIYRLGLAINPSTTVPFTLTWDTDFIDVNGNSMADVVFDTHNKVKYFTFSSGYVTSAANIPKILVTPENVPVGGVTPVEMTLDGSEYTYDASIGGDTSFLNATSATTYAIKEPTNAVIGKIYTMTLFADGVDATFTFANGLSGNRSIRLFADESITVPFVYLASGWVMVYEDAIGSNISTSASSYMPDKMYDFVTASISGTTFDFLAPTDSFSHTTVLSNGGPSYYTVRSTAQEVVVSFDSVWYYDTSGTPMGNITVPANEAVTFVVKEGDGGIFTILGYTLTGEIDTSVIPDTCHYSHVVPSPFSISAGEWVLPIDDIYVDVTNCLDAANDKLIASQTAVWSVDAVIQGNNNTTGDGTGSDRRLGYTVNGGVWQPLGAAKFTAERLTWTGDYISWSFTGLLNVDAGDEIQFALEAAGTVQEVRQIDVKVTTAAMRYNYNPAIDGDTIKFAPATAVGSVVPTLPTESEIEAYASTQSWTSTVVKYTATDLITDNATHAFFVDKAGTVQLIGLLEVANALDLDLLNLTKVNIDATEQGKYVKRTVNQTIEAVAAVDVGKITTIWASGTAVILAPDAGVTLNGNLTIQANTAASIICLGTSEFDVIGTI